MSEFFKSELVQEELREIERLQESIFSNFYKFPSLSKEEQLKQIEILESLLHKQNIFYARLKLSGDPAAQQMKEQLKIQAKQMGFPSGVDLGDVFKNMFRMVEVMRKSVDGSNIR